MEKRPRNMQELEAATNGLPQRLDKFINDYMTHVMNHKTFTIKIKKLCDILEEEEPTEEEKNLNDQEELPTTLSQEAESDSKKHDWNSEEALDQFKKDVKSHNDKQLIKAIKKRVKPLK